MSDKLYMEKEEARMCLGAALAEYKSAAEAYGSDSDEMAEEVWNAIDEECFDWIVEIIT